VREKLKPRYSIRDYQESDEKYLLNFLDRYQGDGVPYPINAEYWHWKNFANPFGPSYVSLACNDHGDIIGVLAFMRWHFRREDQLIQSVRIVNAVTHPEYREEGIATALRQHLMENARKEGALLMFNTPNKNALSVSLKVGSRLVGKLRPCIRILRFRPFLKGLIHSRMNKSFSPPGKTLDFFRCEPLSVSIFEQHREKLSRIVQQDRLLRRNTFRTDRTWDYFRWRYIEHPETPFYTLYLENQNQWDGCIIFRADTYHSLKGIVINEMMMSSPEEHLASKLLNQLVSSLNTDYVLTCFPEGSFHRQILGKNKFRRVPRRSYNLTILVWGAGLGKMPLCMDNWHLTPGELEEAWAWK
jgi:GNAT superfamily N-acetyltransferase